MIHQQAATPATTWMLWEYRCTTFVTRISSPAAAMTCSMNECFDKFRDSLFSLMLRIKRGGGGRPENGFANELITIEHIELNGGQWSHHVHEILGDNFHLRHFSKKKKIIFFRFLGFRFVYRCTIETQTETIRKLEFEYTIERKNIRVKSLFKILIFIIFYNILIII